MNTRASPKTDILLKHCIFIRSRSSRSNPENLLGATVRIKYAAIAIVGLFVDAAARSALPLPRQRVSAKAG